MEKGVHFLSSHACVSLSLVLSLLHLLLLGCLKLHDKVEHLGRIRWVCQIVLNVEFFHSLHVVASLDLFPNVFVHFVRIAGIQQQVNIAYVNVMMVVVPMAVTARVAVALVAIGHFLSLCRRCCLCCLYFKLCLMMDDRTVVSFFGSRGSLFYETESYAWNRNTSTVLQ